MGNLQVWRVNVQMVEEQDIDVNGTVTITFTLMVTAELTFYLLGDLEHLTGQECCFTINSAIEEHIA